MRSCFLSFNILIVYLFLGGALFYYLESEQEMSTRSLLKDLQHNLTIKNATCVSVQDLKYFISLILNASKAGVLEWANQTTAWQWDYSGSLFFSLTTVTTVGYGYLAPATKYGKIACIFYALFGIPIFLNALSQLSVLSKKHIHKLEMYLTKTCRTHNVLKHLILFSLIVSFYTSAFVLPSLYIAKMEDWSLSDSFYYSFITLSTIGFGDFVAGNQQNSSRAYKMFIAIWMLYGLSYMAIFISYMQYLLTKVLNLLAKRRIGPIKTEIANVTLM